MRDAIQSLGILSHLALAYDAWAPAADDGKMRDDECSRWLEALANIGSTRITRSSSGAEWRASRRQVIASSSSRTASLSVTATRALPMSASACTTRGASLSSWVSAEGGAQRTTWMSFLDQPARLLPPWEQPQA
jgi:hypothetical protein